MLDRPTVVEVGRTSYNVPAASLMCPVLHPGASVACLAILSPFFSVSDIAMKTHHWLSIVLTLWLATTARAAEHTEDSLDTVKKNLTEKKAVLIDVREGAEWKRGHLQAAQLVPLSDLRKMTSDAAVRQKLEKNLPKDRIIYCHCASGVRVLSAGDILGKLGYDIRPLKDGFNNLRKAGFPVAENP